MYTTLSTGYANTSGLVPRPASGHRAAPAPVPASECLPVVAEPARISVKQVLRIALRFATWVLRITLLIAAGMLLVAADVDAQQAPGTLSLEEAIQLAKRHSPAFRQQANDESVADWNARAAYGALLPRVDVSAGADWQAGGVPRFGLFSGEEIGLGRTPDLLFSDYSLRVGLTLSGATFFRMAGARAARAATEARIQAAAFTLESDVSQRYLAALRARDAARIAQRELDASDVALRLAQARVEAGAAPRLDAAQAEVQRGRAEVALLQAQANEEIEQLRLFETIGLDPGRTVELTTRFDVFEPHWTLEELTATALESHPQIVSSRKTEASSRAAARAARMSYLPTISIGGGWSGYTRHTRDEAYLIAQGEQNALARMDACERTNDLYSRLADPLPAEDCGRYAFNDETRAAILASNDVFPFNFTKQPPSFGMTISLPIVDGFTREATVQEAVAAADDAKHQRRQEELSRRATVAASYLAVQTAYRSIAIEERNIVAATEQLTLAQERYRLGAGSILELTEAQASMARADQAHLAALYSFHENLAALEAAVGRPLRVAATGGR